MKNNDIKYKFIEDKLLKNSINNKLILLKNIIYYDGFFSFEFKKDIIYLLLNKFIIDKYKDDKNINDNVDYILIVNDDIFDINNENIDLKMKMFRKIIFENGNCCVCYENDKEIKLNCIKCFTIICNNCILNLNKCPICKNILMKDELDDTDDEYYILENI